MSEQRKNGSDRRQRAARAFADTQPGWRNRPMRLIAGDASNRKYYRLSGSKTSALVMDAPPEKGEDIGPFARIARYLSQNGFSAPRILAQNAEDGFLMIEDFGDGIFARLFEAGQEEAPLYAAATDLLVALHRCPPPADLPAYDAAMLAEMASLAAIWYRKGVTGEQSTAEAAEIRDRMRARLVPLDAELTCLIQRDYHAENLIWLPEREGVARVGLLDFQDAMRGHPAYDLVSILQDARRDVSPALAEAMLSRYIAATGRDDAPFRAAYHALGLQRNLRILGVFARLCLRDGKPHYLSLLPRVWGHVTHDLAQLGEAGLTAFLCAALPAPTTSNIARIANACPTPSPA